MDEGRELCGSMLLTSFSQECLIVLRGFLLVLRESCTVSRRCGFVRKWEVVPRASDFVRMVSRAVASWGCGFTRKVSRMWVRQEVASQPFGFTSASNLLFLRGTWFSTRNPRGACFFCRCLFPWETCLLLWGTCFSVSMPLFCTNLFFPEESVFPELCLFSQGTCPFFTMNLSPFARNLFSLESWLL